MFRLEVNVVHSLLFVGNKGDICFQQNSHGLYSKNLWYKFCAKLANIIKNQLSFEMAWPSIM